MTSFVVRTKMCGVYSLAPHRAYIIIKTAGHLLLLFSHRSLTICKIRPKKNNISAILSFLCKNWKERSVNGIFHSFLKLP